MEERAGLMMSSVISFLLLIDRAPLTSFPGMDFTCLEKFDL